jgi:hypothetical protein
MIVDIAADGALVHEADDCTRLSVRTGLGGRELDAALASAGFCTRAGDGDVLLDVETLHERARAAAVAPDWESKWSAMIGYAGSKGWLTPDGSAVQAHIETTA